MIPPSAKVAINEVEQPPTKTMKSHRNPAVQLKSALKRKPIAQKNFSKGTASENDLVLLEEEESDDDSSDDDDPDDDGDENDDGSDDGGAGNSQEPFDPKDLPSSKTVQKGKSDPTKRESTEHNSGVVYLGRIPHGFYEDEMKGYFSQFGEVIRLKLSRNKKTGKPRHYGFIEFKHVEVAQIVVETLDNYLLCGKLLDCKLVDKSQIHPKFWIGAGKKFRKDWRLRLRRQERNQIKSPAQQTVISDRLIAREKRKRKRLAELGIDYDFPGYVKPSLVKDTTDELPKEEPREVKRMKKPKRDKGASGLKNRAKKTRP